MVARFDGQDRAIERIGQKLVRYGERLTNRRRIQPRTKDEHIEAVFRLGRRCPLYPQITVVAEDGRPIPNACEFDHFFTNQKPDADHTWLISKKAHDDLTYGPISRDEAMKCFTSYQVQRKRLPGRQPSLFG